MKPMGAIPPYFAANSSGQLLIGGEPAEDLVAEAGGTPLFVYDNNIVGTQIARLAGGDARRARAILFSQCKPLCRAVVKFSWKVCRRLSNRLGGRAGAAEARPARRESRSTSPVPASATKSWKPAIEAGATISVESEGEAGRAIHAAEQRRHPAEDRRSGKPAVRRSRVDASPRAQAPSPFGVDAELAPALVQAAYRSRASTGAACICSPAAQCLDAAALERSAQGDRLLARRRSPRQSACPCPSSTSAAGSMCLLSAGRNRWTSIRVAEALHADLVRWTRAARDDASTIELGRWLVGEAGVYLARVIDRTESCGKTFVTTDGGGHHFLRATGCLHERGHGNFPIAVANRFDAPAEEEVTVTGCLCYAARHLRRRGDAAEGRPGRPDRDLLRRRLRPRRASPQRVGKPPAGEGNAGLGVDAPRRNRGRGAGR